MTNAPAVQEMIRLLGSHLTQVKVMLGILEREYIALSKKNLENFDAIVREKLQQIKLLEDIEPELTPFNAVVDAQAGGNVEKFIAGISDRNHKASFQTLWKEFRQTLTRCNELNLTNQRILKISHHNLQLTLDILRGESTQPRLYGSSGKYHSGAAGQSLAVA